MIITAEHHWVCPNCDLTEVTVGRPNRFHNCPGLFGLLSPMVVDGVRCKVVAEERQDYIGREDVPLTEGRPYMAVRTVRDNGEDLAVFAPTAHVKIRE